MIYLRIGFSVTTGASSKPHAAQAGMVERAPLSGSARLTDQYQLITRNSRSAKLRGFGLYGARNALKIPVVVRSGHGATSP